MVQETGPKPDDYFAVRGVCGDSAADELRFGATVAQLAMIEHETGRP
jgi:hypothetical protein